MADAMWMVVFIQLFSGVTMWPLPSSSCPTITMYDICIENDLHQIEELRKSLFESLNESPKILDENKSSVAFGLLDDDWKRLLVLEDQIPEGSVLKSKVLAVFRILIAALHQAHGKTFEKPDERDNSLVGEYEVEEEGGGNNGYYDEKDSSRELEGGESKKYNNVVVKSDFDSRPTTFRSMVSSSSNSLSENWSKYADPQIMSKPPTKLKQFKYKNTFQPLDNEEKTTTTVSYGVTKRREDLEEKGDDSIFAPTIMTNISTSDQISVPTASLETDETLTETSYSMKNKPIKGIDETKMNDTSSFPGIVGSYIEGDINSLPTKKSRLQKLRNGISSKSADYIASAIYTKLMNPTSNIISLGDKKATTYMFPKETTERTTLLADPISYNRYPEIIQLSIEKEKANIEHNVGEAIGEPTTTSPSDTSEILQDTISTVLPENELSEYSANEENTRESSENMSGLVNTEHILSLENHKSQNNSAESNVFSPPNKDNVSRPLQPSPENSEPIESLEKDGLQISSVEKNDLNSHNVNTDVIRLFNLSDPMSSVENKTLQSSIEEEDIFSSSTNGYSASTVKEIILNNPEHTTISENEDVKGIKLGQSFFSTENNCDARPSEQTNLESSKLISSAENERFDSSSVEISIISQSSDDVLKHAPNSSERIANEKNHDEQFSSSEINIHTPTNNNVPSPAAKSPPENSEGTKKSKAQSSKEEKYVFSNPKNKGDASSAIQSIPESSEQVLSVENSTLQSSVESNVVSRHNIDDTNTYEQVPRESFEVISSAEKEKMQTSHNLKHLDEDSNEETTFSTLYDLANYLKKNATENSETEFDIDESASKQDFHEPSQKVDDALLKVEQSTESLSTVNVLLPKSADKPFPKQSYSELNTYPVYQYPYNPTNFFYRKSCPNRNGCVRVRHIEYKTNDGPSSTRLTNRVNSRFKVKPRESYEIEDYSIPTYYMTRPEKLIWEDRLRNSRESTDDYIVQLTK